MTREMDRVQYRWTDRHIASQTIRLLAVMRDGQVDESVDSQHNGLIQ
jgi:hypothetical protein